MNGTWLMGLLRRRPLRIWGSAAGVALTVAFLALLLAFVSAGRANMTARAAQSVPVDWQVLLGQNARLSEAEKAVRAATATGVEGVAAAAAVCGCASAVAPAEGRVVARAVAGDALALLAARDRGGRAEDADAGRTGRRS